MLANRALIVAFSIASASAAANPAWPNGPDEDPRLAYPNDPSYIQIDGNGDVTGGEWNFWSFVPANWASKPKFRQAEVAIGTGIHADRAWQRTTGDRRVIIAVLDSGIEWEHPDLVNKHYLNKAELGNCKPDTVEGATDEWDINGDGVFSLPDYLVKDPAYGAAKDAAGNNNGIFDPGDLIRTCSDGVDDDNNGFTDDISGWDAYRSDNDPYDDTRYGHGTGEARDSAAEGNNGIGGLGVCPNCTVLMVRVGDSFVADANEFATGVIFAVDSGASVIQEALGSVNNTAYSMAAIEYAYRNNAVVIASAADELSFHQNSPGTNNHTTYVHAIVHDESKASKSTTFLNYNNCTNHGGNLLLSTPGGGCSSEATGITSGHAGLMYSAGLQAGLEKPLTAEEIRAIMITTVDDIDVPESKTDQTKFPSGPGWDMHFGYGRNNARRSVDVILDGAIPPESDIVSPLWFEPINVRERKSVEVMGRVGGRVDGLSPRYEAYTWTLEYALGVDPKDGWEAIATGNTALGGEAPAAIATWDVEKAAKRIDFLAPLEDAHQWTVTLRLRVEAPHNGSTLKSEFRKTVHLIDDPDLQPGYPRYAGSSAEGSPKFVDIDGDGAEEAIVGTTDGLIHAWKLDGTEPTGWPIELPMRKDHTPGNKGYISEACAFRDAANKEGCRAATTVDKTIARQTLMLGIAVGALEGNDDDLSTVVATYDGMVAVYDEAGALRPGWPQHIDDEWYLNTDPQHLKDDGFFGAPVLYDLDGDNKLEIIAAGMDAMLYVWHADGKPMAGWPVLIHDPLENEVAHMIMTPGVGDIDNDGLPEIVVGTNEVYGGNEGRAYMLKATGASQPDKITEALEPGWPITLIGAAVNVLPLVGRGCPSNPALADLDGDGTLEMNIDTIGYLPSFWRYDGEPYLRPNPDGFDAQVNNVDFGTKANTLDSPAFVLINSGTFANLDGKGPLEFFKGTAGFDFALAFAEGGKRAFFDHQVSGWNTDTFLYLDAWPRKIEDWQFFMNPTAVDIDGDGQANLLNGSGGYLVHAWNYKGQEPAGWPKNTGGWIIGAPTAGDMDGDGKWDIYSSTRSGWVFVWKAPGAVSKKGIEWQTYAHDYHNTNNYEEPVGRYNNYPDEPAGSTDSTDGADSTDSADSTDVADATDGTDSTDGTDGVDATDGSDAADGTDATDAADSGDATDGSTVVDGTTPAAESSSDGCTTGGRAFSPLAGLLTLAALVLVRRRRAASR